MNSLIPQFDQIDCYKFYNLNYYRWIFNDTNTAIKNNSSIVDKLFNDFSEYSGLPVESINKVFNIDYLKTRSTEPLMLLYINKNSDNVHYYLIDDSETYQKLRK